MFRDIALLDFTVRFEFLMVSISCKRKSHWPQPPPRRPLAAILIRLIFKCRFLTHAVFQPWIYAANPGEATGLSPFAGGGYPVFIFPPALYWK
jgi:hypothetical protein